MIIKQLLNNNAIIAVDEKQDEVIVIGTGLGFKSKVGTKVDESKIQKTFVLKEHSKLGEIVSAIPVEYLEAVERIVNHTENNYGIKMDDNIYLILTEHIYFAIMRLQQGLILDNPFLTDIKSFYKKEYEAAEFAKGILDEMFQVTIPEEEIGYIAMHILETSNHMTSIETSDILKIVDMVMSVILDKHGDRIKIDSLSYNRMLAHVKYFAKRFYENKENPNENVELSELLHKSFKKEYRCIETVSKTMKKIYGREMTDAEKMYLVLHLRNCLELND